MKSRTIVIIILLAVAGVFTGLYYLFIYPYKLDYKWVESLDVEDENPYGTYYFYEILKSSQGYDNFFEIDESLTGQLDSTETNGVYMVIGQYVNHDSVEQDRLRKFVERGNTAFFSLGSFHNKLASVPEFYDSTAICTDEIDSSRVTVTFDDGRVQPVPFLHRYAHDTTSYRWWYFDSCYNSALANDSLIFRPNTLSGEVVVLNRLNGEYPNLVKFKYGRGEVYLHANPVMFGNIFIITEDGYRYANKCLEPFAGKNIYWDEAGKIPYYSAPAFTHQSVLKYIFAQPGLKWAWYVALAGVLSFLVFRSGRKQKIIPVLPEKQNSSAAFVKAVAFLYKSTGNHQQIAGEMMRYFLQFVKLKYGIRIKLNETEKYVEPLAEVSGVDENIIQKIFKLNIQLEVNDDGLNSRLMTFDENLEKFYKNCK